MRISVLALALGLTCVHGLALAQDAPTSPAATPPAATPPAATPPTAATPPQASGPTPKPAPAPKSSPAKANAQSAAPKTNPVASAPKTPFYQALKKGDSAYLARDFDGALASYREAVQKEPRNALAHYRIGAAQVAKNDLKEAEQAYGAGLRFVGNDLVLKAKLLFCLADLAERARVFDQALERWTAYGKDAEEPKSNGYPATAGERKKVVETEQKLISDYAEVKARIEKRLKEAEEASKKSAK
jgi:tetratricopeptide (TPR) repeat protein